MLCQTSLFFKEIVMRCLIKETYDNVRTILIVDDSKLILKVEEILCGRAGFNVVTANSADEALCKISSKVDLILTDIQMPSMNGVQLAKKIHEKYPDLSIFGITSMTSDAIHNIDKSNFEMLLEKPLKLETCQWLLSKTQQRAC